MSTDRPRPTVPTFVIQYKPARRMWTLKSHPQGHFADMHFAAEGTCEGGLGLYSALSFLINRVATKTGGWAEVHFQTAVFQVYFQATEKEGESLYSASQFGVGGDHAPDEPPSA